MNEAEFKLIIATRNNGKLREIQSLLAGVPVTVLSLSDIPAGPEVAETGSTFKENACIKAKEYASRSGLYTVADDSGLEVEALNGAPGVFSARYGGHDLDYPSKMQLLLQEVSDVGHNRKARFLSSVAFASPDGEIMFTAQGVCDGTLSEHPRGEKGFGYDPIFIPEGFDQTLGELTADVKSSVSHRARAVEIFVRYFLDFIGVRLDRTNIGL